MNIDHFIPNKSIFGKDLFCLDKGGDIYIWYSVGGGANYIKLKRNVNLELLSELIGFYFGDGNTNSGIRSFRISNCEPSVLIYCLNILYKMGISKETLKCQVIFSTPKNILENKIINRFTNYWSRILHLKKVQIVSVTRSNGKTESLKYGSARIFLDNCSFVEILVNEILPNFLNFIKNPKRKEDQIILNGFLRGLAAAEGSVSLTKKYSLSRISLSFDPHSDEINLYRKILSNIGVEPGGKKGNELFIYGINNFKLFNNIDLFKMHNTRKEKFNKGYKNHKFS